MGQLKSMMVLAGGRREGNNEGEGQNGRANRKLVADTHGVQLGKMSEGNGERRKQ